MRSIELVLLSFGLFLTGVVKGQGGEVLRALSARPVPEAMQGAAKVGLNTHFLYENLPQSLPIMDDFSIDRTRKRWSQPDDANVSLQETIYRLAIGGISSPDMGFATDTTFRFIIDNTDPDTIIVTREPLETMEVTVRDLSVFPPTEELVTVWPAYTIFDTLMNPPLDTLFFTAPGLRQDSLLVYAVAPDPRTYQMGAATVPLILWEDDDVFVNNTYPLNPPTIGVATFDGLSRTGMPYDFANFSSYGIADHLTSVPINLQYPASDSVYLSFYYQARGLSGDAYFQPQDSLVLEFYAPQEQLWYRVWRMPYPQQLAVQPFQQVMIPIREFRYLQQGFRMRFLNYATLSGSFDHWHLDYVRLAAQRRHDDTTLVDVAYIYPESTLLQTYTSVPFAKYEQSPVSYMAQSVSMQQRNLDDEDRFITYGFLAKEENDATIFNRVSGLNTSGNLSSIFTSDYIINPVDSPFIYDPSLSTDAAFWEVKFWTNATPDINRYNDTTTFVQELSNYYAYDDGTAEMGYGLNTIGAKLAYRFDMAGEDSLRAIRMYFNPIANPPPGIPPTDGSFLLTVWKSLSPEVIIHQDFTFSSPQYRDHGLNQFVEYPLDSTIWVEGTIYVGWTQTNEANMNLGFDRNRNNANKIFFKTGNSWQSTQQQGSLMMRPVFVAAVDPFTSVPDVESGSSGLLLFPNPANAGFHMRYDGPVQAGSQYQCIDATGRIVQQGAFINEAPVPTDGLANGLYTVRLIDRSGMVLAFGRLSIQR